MQKWHIAKELDTISRFNGPINFYSYTGTTDDYIDFRTDGRMYRSKAGVKDTLPFQIGTNTITLTQTISPQSIVFNIVFSNNDSLELYTLTGSTITNSHDRTPVHLFLNR